MSHFVPAQAPYVIAVFEPQTQGLTQGARLRAGAVTVAEIMTSDSRRMRKPLSNVGGGTKTWGSREMTSMLDQALRAPSPEGVDRLTHGFHSYPARMHPDIAAVVLKGMDSKNRRVWDPFCGSGTVLIEAMVSGWTAGGSDLNPLAVRLSQVKTNLRGAQSRERFLAVLREVTEKSAERVSARTPQRVSLTAEERAWYEPHVLQELGGLYREIQAIPAKNDRRALELVFSSIIVKFSKQQADTKPVKIKKNIGKGLPTRFFQRKGEELVQRWKVLKEAAPRRAPRPNIVEGGVRQLTRWAGEQTMDLILTSPPYGGTYDYVSHHARRFPWLGLSTMQFEREEIGSRRQLGGRDEGRWDQQLKTSLAAMHKTLAPSGWCVLLMGDGVVGNKLVSADRHVTQVAKDVGFLVVAGASQTRADRSGHGVRREHLLVFRRPA